MFRPELPKTLEPELALLHSAEQNKNGVTIYLEKVYELEEKSFQERRVLEYLAFLRKHLMDERNYIDQGGLAKIYSMGDKDICIKIMRNRHLVPSQHSYKLGATPLEEFAIMESLHGFSHGGIRCPIPEACIESGDSAAIIMEKLDAVNLQHVLNGEEKMPEGFNSKEFFTALGDYIQALHDDKGIAHRDLYPRNIMIDRKTGQGYVIDFGNAERISGLSEEEQQKRIDDDFKKYDDMYIELENFVQGKQVKKEVFENRHEVHHFGRQTKIAFSKQLKKEAIKVAKKMLYENSSIGFLPLGDAKSSLAVSSDRRAVIGHHHFSLEGVTFYVGIEKDEEEG